MPDPSCNPYLALAVMLAAGLDGVREGIDPGPPVNKNIFAMSQREKRRLKIQELPANLGEALESLEKNRMIKEVLGEHILEHFPVFRQLVGSAAQELPMRERPEPLARAQQSTGEQRG